MVKFTILAGGYTTFITRLLFQTSPPSLSVVDTYPAGNNVSWLSLSPLNKSVLYGTNENTIGSLLSFTIDKSQAVHEVSSIPSLGNDPAFTASLSDGKQALILNYNTGNGRFVPLSSDLLHFGSPQTITFQAPVNGFSHPHFFTQYNSEVFVSDLGADKIWRLSQETNGTWFVTGYIPQPSGSGPRRVAISGNTIYVLHELFNSLSEQIIPASRFSTADPTIKTLLTTPPGVNTTNGTYHAAELLFPKPNLLFPQEFLYVSNRDTGIPDPRGDSVAIFATNPLRFVTQVYTGLDQIRGMELGGPNNEYLIAAGLTDGGVAVFERIDGGASLKLLARNTEAVSQDRSTFIWLT
ncbi:putative isomerase YbhE [Sistotremastrum niveocremeum HHB9708]|uniref:Putative isomerase YbhE n=2 Tax=Sistotremastraceae TaxID=3402574 RepID=A0A164PYC3_9AGAM|nr:putative isomerase YbhE [Sistotremastrum niveocremeum HHB9708]KZT33331.1 putative isomerase YbhE [Sistotremastrum suecicum HHB10207 ss-3]